MLRALSVAKPIRVLGQTAVAASVTGTATETTLGSIVIPGGTLGPNDSVRITSTWSVTNSANTKTLKVKFGADIISNQSLTTFATMREERVVSNRNSVSSQLAFGGTIGGFGSSTVVAAALTNNTANDVTIAFTGQLALTSETITLQGYTVEILPG